MCSVPWGYHDARGGYHDAHEGYYEYHGGVQHCGGKNLQLSLQWTTWALYGASYMYGIHHLNNYHHKSKSTGIMWGFVWDPCKRCFLTASSLSSLQQTSRVSYGIQLYKCFRAAFTLSSLQQTLQVSYGALYKTRLDRCLG